MQTHYSVGIVLISLLVAIFASYVSLDLVRSIAKANSRTKSYWIFGSSVAMGLGIWSMHYIGMLAFHIQGMTMAYDIPLMILSVFVAISASSIGLMIINEPVLSTFSLATGGSAMALAIVGMHYIGMLSMRMDALIQWNTGLILVSIVVALLASCITIALASRIKDQKEPLITQLQASAIFGLGIAGMHYIGMEAATFVYHIHREPDHDGVLLASENMNTVVIASTALILGIVFAVNWINRVLAKRTRELEEKNRLYHEAELANITKTRFLANMSHEIRTPISAIIGFSDFLLNDKLSPEEQKNYIATINRSAHGLAKLIDDILDLSKIEMNQISYEFTSLELQQFMADIISLFKIKAEQKGLTFIYESRITQSVNLKTDGYRLRQILINIINNAIKFTQTGAITLRSEITDKWVQFEIQDTGIGISPEQQLKLFKPFSQADSSTARRFGGTGLGLEISKKLAQGLGGDLILLSSSPEAGSTFQLKIPYRTTHLAPQAGKSLTTDEKPLSGFKILLAEDVEDNQFLIARYLSKQGAEVQFANNGVEAVEKAQKEHFHYILMDIQMPILDGYQATAELRKKGYRRPIIALTAHAMPEEKRACLQAGCDDFHTKPINIKTLVTVLLKHKNKVNLTR